MTGMINELLAIFIVLMILFSVLLIVILLAVAEIQHTLDEAIDKATITKAKVLPWPYNCEEEV